jgi:hypothetical protein
VARSYSLRGARILRPRQLLGVRARLTHAEATHKLRWSAVVRRRGGDAWTRACDLAPARFRPRFPRMCHCLAVRCKTFSMQSPQIIDRIFVDELIL